jgi:hypothetical protein
MPAYPWPKGGSEATVANLPEQEGPAIVTEWPRSATRLVRDHQGEAGRPRAESAAPVFAMTTRSVKRFGERGSGTPVGGGTDAMAASRLHGTSVAIQACMAGVLPDTAHRVPRQTAADANRNIREQTAGNVARTVREGPEAIRARLRALDREWDIERTLEANAAVVSLIGLGLGSFVHRSLFLVPAVVAAFLLQHALHGWCPPLPLFRRLGVRTAREIAHERYALKALRGDFESIGHSAGHVTENQIAAAGEAVAR